MEIHRRHHSRPHIARSAQSRLSGGFSLLEVLISIIILSFGVLGMVGMQATALQSNRDARLQSTAVEFARELAEMMRGDRAAAELTSATNPYLRDFTAPLTPLTASYCLNVAGTGCGNGNTADAANAQMTEWLSRVAAELPGAHVKVCTDSAPIDNSGYPTWDCTASAAGTTAAIFIKIGWTRGGTDRSSASYIDRANRPSILFPVAGGNY